MMKRVLLVLIALPIAWFVGRALVYELVSDETRIRWHLEAMRDGYNSGDVGDVVELFHHDWRHQRPSVDRETLRAALIQEFFQDRDSQTKELLRRVDMDLESMDLVVADDGAQLQIEVWISRRAHSGDWQERWRADVEARWIRTERGWRIIDSGHVDKNGTIRSR